MIIKRLRAWYQAHNRPLPWRRNKDPYQIWISETMLQQTTVKAVIPFYERFLKRFPTVADLASAELSEVYHFWSGLGYYSRARNLHAASKTLSERGFPRDHKALQALPGFGPYTSRAVASISFDEPVGVLDGNVIRVLSRLYNDRSEWWRPKERRRLQSLVDGLVQGHPSSEVNQALMELGATICTPANPFCNRCPVSRECEARGADQTQGLPLRKPRKNFEHWIWKVQIPQSRGRVGVQQNTYAPFLKKHWIFPGEVTRAKSKPKQYDFIHTITHHKIYVQVGCSVTSKSNKDSLSNKAQPSLRFIKKEELSQASPSSLMNKVLRRTFS